ncbi:MAG: hypothetical protein HZB92_04545 [Euryarchaeota archaeon]|nr:hypothetical protein [Euryarchaeota archaeon]
MGVPNWLRFKRRDLSTAIVFVIAGVCVRLALLDFNVPNFEPVMALTIIASMVMPLALAVIVPIGIMAVTDTLIYAFNIRGEYGMAMIAGITFFVWTGFLMATLVGWRLKKRYAFRIGNLGMVTGAGVLTTLIFDLWTDIGVWWFSYPAHTLDDAIRVLQLQTTFTLIHIASSLIFIPLFGSGYMLLTEHKTGITSPKPVDEAGRHSGRA